MSKLSKEDILKLAKLARLHLADEEVEKYQKELSSILEYVDMLNTVDTGDLSPTYQVTGLTNVYRKDEPYAYGPDNQALLQNAPAVQDGQFKVKRMIG